MIFIYVHISMLQKQLLIHNKSTWASTKHIIAGGLCPGVLLIKSKALNESSLPCGITFPWAPKMKQVGNRAALARWSSGNIFQNLKKPWFIMVHIDFWTVIRSSSYLFRTFAILCHHYPASFLKIHPTPSTKHRPVTHLWLTSKPS